MRWRERVAEMLATSLPWSSRVEWAARSGESISHINACAISSEADRKTLRLVDVLFLAPDERAAVLNAIEEWARAIERGDA